MKNIYIFFVLLTYLTLNSIALRANSIEIKSVNSSDHLNTSIESAIIDDSFEFSNSSNSLFNELSVNEQQINSIANYDSRLKIRLEFFTSKNYKREILLTIDSRSTDAVDKGFDALLNNDFPNDMYWMLNEDKLVIQAFNELKKDRVVPIGIKSMGDCSIQIKVDTIENPYEGMEVYLRDNSTMDTYDIKNGVFEVALEEGQFNDKYAIVFVPKVQIEDEAVEVINETEIEEIENEMIENEEVINDLRVFVGGNNELLRIKKPEEMKLTSIAMFNLLGQQINTWNANLNSRDIDLPIHANKGVHLLLMDTSKGRIMKKVLIK